MSNREFDFLLACHCAPALAGIKPANLLSVPKSPNDRFPELLREYQRRFEQTEIRLELFKECDRRSLLLVYQQEKLWRWLQEPENKAFLIRCGYTGQKGLQGFLKQLKERLEREDFPHEIGIFLGYPLADVRGFLQNGGKQYLLSSYWKVYADPLRARRCFAQMTLCRRVLCRRVLSGESLFDIFHCPAREAAPHSDSAGRNEIFSSS